MFEAEPSRSSARSPHEVIVIGLEEDRSGFVRGESIVAPTLGFKNAHNLRREKLADVHLKILNALMGHVNMARAIKKRRMV